MHAFHLVARARPGRLLFSDAEEGSRLWRTATRAAPGLLAVALMPNHVHLVHPVDVRRPLADALGRYVRWRNHRRGSKGPLLQPLPPAERISDEAKLRRQVRYVHLNPCRAHLVDDPLSWPWTTHRDRLGLSLSPVVKRHAQPRRFHRYVSGDPSVHPDGTELPQTLGLPADPMLVRRVVASLARVPESVLCRRGPWRSVYLSVATTLCDAPPSEVRRLVGVGRGARVGPFPVETELVGRVLHDPRFQEPEAGKPWRWGGQRA